MPYRKACRQSETAVVHGDGTRHCAWCGDYIDPIDWCGDCTEVDGPCVSRGGPHRRLRKRSDAAYCDNGCKSADRNDRRKLEGGSVGHRRISRWAQQPR